MKKFKSNEERLAYYKLCRERRAKRLKKLTREEYLASLRVEKEPGLTPAEITEIFRVWR